MEKPLTLQEKWELDRKTIKITPPIENIEVKKIGVKNGV